MHGMDLRFSSYSEGPIKPTLNPFHTVYPNAVLIKDAKKAATCQKDHSDWKGHVRNNSPVFPGGRTSPPRICTRNNKLYT